MDNIGQPSASKVIELDSTETKEAYTAYPCDDLELADTSKVTDNLMWRYRFGRSLCKFLMKISCGYRVEGGENVPANGAAILVCNHQSLLDPPLLSIAIPQRQIFFIAKKELRSVPIVGLVLEGCGCVWIDRQAKDGKALLGANEILEQDKLLGIFPEGTRSKTDKLLKPRSGAAVLAIRTGLPVIPAAVINTGYVGRHGMLLGKGNIGVRIGRPFKFKREDNPDPRHIVYAKKEIMDRISELMAKGLPQ